MNWRNIPGWPGYQIDARGCVRTERGYQVPIYGQTYYLKRQGVRHRISRAELIQLMKHPTCESSPASFHGDNHGDKGFVPIPECPDYGINRMGVVRNPDGKEKERDPDKSGIPNILINGRHKRLNILLCLAFGPGAATAAGLPEPDAKRFGRRSDDKVAVNPHFSRNLEKKQGRCCHDCGRPTRDYRCPACWRKLRGFSAEEAAAHETPFAL